MKNKPMRISMLAILLIILTSLLHLMLCQMTSCTATKPLTVMCFRLVS